MCNTAAFVATSYLTPAVLIHADIMEFFHLLTVNNAYQLRKRGLLGGENPVTGVLTHHIAPFHIGNSNSI